MQSLKISPCVSIPPNTNSNISLSFSSAVSAVLSPDIKHQITEDCINLFVLLQHLLETSHTFLYLTRTLLCIMLS